MTDKELTHAMWSARNLPLEKKIGQLFMLGFSGTKISAEIDEWIRQRGLGSIILFRRNMEIPEEIQVLIHQLQKRAAQTEAAIPLFIAIDQEGGRVSRLPPPFTQFPSPAALGKTQSTALLYAAAKAMATELRAVGITMNLAPVLDVNTNAMNPVIGSRAFGSDPALVSRLGAVCVKGLQEEGIIATGKHFPGHGDTSLDSHFSLPVVKHHRERLRQVELPPFVEAIRTGVGALMTAHVLYPSLDPFYPATLSRSILTGLLREELGFSGVIITDDLIMQAITDHHSMEEAAVLALQAGVDILLLSHGADQQQEAYQAIRTAVQRGDIREDYLERSVERILTLKTRFSPLSFSPRRIAEIVDQDAHRALVTQIIQQMEKGV